MRLFAQFITIGLAASQLIGPVGPTTPLKKKTVECNVLNYGAFADNSTDISFAIERTFTNVSSNAPEVG